MAQAAVNARNARFKSELGKGKVRGASGKEDPRVVDRIEAAEKAVENFVARRLQPAVQKVCLYLA